MIVLKNAEADSTQRLSVRKKLIFAGLTLILFFLALELLLTLLGVEPAYQSGDPLVGFSQQLPHFTEEKNADGTTMIITASGKETALNPQRFPKKKPENTYRIVCLGGSTTYGRPFWDETSFSGWLRAYLPAADSSRKWEVINGGGISYASYRILAVMEELAMYSPDLFVIYLGHNEFLEQRTYGNLLDQPELFKDLRASTYRLRTSTLLEQIGDRLLDRNAKKSIVFGDEVKRIPIDSVGPEAYRRDEAFREKVVTHFMLSLNRMIDVAERHGAQVVLISPASNLRHFVPFKSEHSAGLDAASLDKWTTSYREAVRSLEAGDPTASLTHLQECIAMDPGYAEAQYLLGLTLESLGRYSEARSAFVRAIEEDIVPLRAIKATTSAIEELARTHDIPFVDLQKILDAKTEYGITGDDFFHDHVHLTIEANRLLALEIMDCMEARKWMAPKWSDDDRARVEAHLLDNISRDRYAEELIKLTYVMDSLEQEHMAHSTLRRAIALEPNNETVLNYAVSFYAKTKQLEKVVEILEIKARKSPEDPRIFEDLGKTYFTMGLYNKAADAYKRLLNLKPDDASTLQFLGVALSLGGDHSQAAKYLNEAVQLNPDSAELHSDLGLILAKNEQYSLAVTHYAKAVSLKPSLASTYYNWGLALLELEKPQEAIAKFEHVLELQPGHRGATENLRMLQNNQK